MQFTEHIHTLKAIISLHVDINTRSLGLNHNPVITEQPALPPEPQSIEVAPLVIKPRSELIRTITF